MRTRLKTVAALSVAFTMAGPAAGDETLFNLARKAVMDKLHDPESARFTDLLVKTESNRSIVCGRVNAKNRRGGYDGFRPFLYSTKPELVIIYGGFAVTDDVISHLAQMKGFENSCGTKSN